MITAFSIIRTDSMSDDQLDFILRKKEELQMIF